MLKRSAYIRGKQINPDNMKRFFSKMTCAFLAVSLLAVSCSKDNDDDSTPTITGFWSGAYGNGTSIPTLDYAFLFRTDGTVRVFNNSDTTAATKAEGTYTISGVNVNTTYSYIGQTTVYNTKAIANESFTQMNGQWGSGTSTSSGGTFYLDK